VHRAAPQEAVIPIEIVITGLDPVIHLLRKSLLRRLIDARIKSGHDECGCVDFSFRKHGFAISRPDAPEVYLASYLSLRMYKT
jgi:hypothetical protein